MRTSRFSIRRPGRRNRTAPRHTVLSVFDDPVLLCECADGACDC